MLKYHDSIISPAIFTTNDKLQQKKHTKVILLRLTLMFLGPKQMLTMQVVRLRLCRSQTHRFLRDFVGDLVRLVEEAHGRDVAQRSKTPEGEGEGEGEEST